MGGPPGAPAPSSAEGVYAEARAALRQAWLEESYLTPLVCAAQARVAMHRKDLPAARQELIAAQRSRHELTYAIPHVAVQVRIELARVYLALSDLEGARTLMREIDELLRRRPGLGTLVNQARALRDTLAWKHGSNSDHAPRADRSRDHRRPGSRAVAVA